MNRISFLSARVVALLICLAALLEQARGATVASWNNADLNTTVPVSAATGIGTVSRGSALNYINTANTYNSSGWRTAGTASSGPTFANQFVEIAVDTTNFTSITLFFSHQRNVQGAQNTQVFYSTNGGVSFTASSVFNLANTSLAARSVNLTNIPALDNNPNVVFRLHGYSAGNAAGQMRFQSISLTGNDTVAPTVLSINRANPSPTNANTLNYTVTFSEPVTGVSASNFSLSLSGVTGSIGTITGSGATYNVPVIGVSGNGTLRLDLVNNLSSIQDLSSNALTTGFSPGQTYSISGSLPVAYQSLLLIGGNGNQIFDALECNELKVTLLNGDSTTLTIQTARLSTSTPGVFVTQADSAYGDIGPGSTAQNTANFFLSTTNSFRPDRPIDFQLQIGNGALTNTLTFSSTVPAATVTRYNNNTVQSIPDATSGAVGLLNSTVTASGLLGSLTTATVSLHATHVRDGDLRLTLVSPSGQTVLLSNKRGANIANYGSACGSDPLRTTFSDGAATAITGATAPFVGSFRPEQALGELRGLTGANLNGTWTLRVEDTKRTNTGSLQCWSLILETLDVSTSSSGSCGNTPTSDVSVTKQLVSGTPANGDTLAFVVTVTNNSASTTATGVTMTDTLPNQVLYVGTTTSNGGAISLNGSDVVVTWPTLAPLAQTSTTIYATAIEAGSSTNIAVVQANQLDTNTNNNRSELLTTVLRMANLQITNTDSPDPQTVGSNVTYTMAVTNLGPDPADSVVVSNVLGSGLSFVSNNSTSGSASFLGQNGTANIGDLDVGGAATVTAIASATACGVTSNSATASSLTTDTVGSNNNVVATTTLRDPAPTLSIGAPSTTSTASGPVSYVVTYSGAASISLAPGDVTVTPTGSAGAGVVSVTGSGNTRNVELSSITGNGTLRISIAAATAAACGGFTAASAGPSATFDVDNVAPTVTSLTYPSASPTSATSLLATVVFSEPVQSFTSEALSLSVTGSVAGVIGDPEDVSGGTTWTVPITGISGDGELAILQSGPGSTTDLVFNPLAGTATGTTVTIDQTAPTLSGLTGITRRIVRVSFTEANGLGARALDPTAYTASGPGLGSASATPDTATLFDPNTVELTFNSGDFDFGLSLTITGAADIRDAAGNPLGSPDNANTLVVPVTLSHIEIE